MLKGTEGHDMDREIRTLLNKIVLDYKDFNQSLKGTPEVREKMLKEFIEGLRIDQGNKYLKVVTGNSVWGFVVTTPRDAKFRQGDILRPASWAAPARNHARGNVFDDNYNADWTGPRYM